MPEVGDGHLVQVGQVVRPHGLRGEVVVDLWSDVPERLAPGALLLAGGRGLRVATERPFGHRHLVTFEGVADRSSADDLRGAVLEAPAIDLPETLWVDDLVGSAVLDTTGAPLGTVVAVEANPASDLLVLDGGGLVPLRFLVDHRPGEVVVDPPAGLLE